MKELLAAIFGPLDAALGAIPFSASRWLIVIFLALAGIVPQFLPREYVYLGAPDQSRWRDLRLWTAAVVAIYVLIYAIV